MLRSLLKFWSSTFGPNSDKNKEEFLDAISRGDTAQVHKMINAGINVNYIFFTTRELTPLRCALEQKHIAILKLLLAAGARFDGAGATIDDSDTTCAQLGIHNKFGLHWFIENNHTELLVPLVQAGAPLDIGGSYTRRQDGIPPGHYLPKATALDCAVLQERLDIVLLLLYLGAEVDGHKSHNSMTPLHCAIAIGNEPIAAALIRGGADINAKYLDMTAGNPLGQFSGWRDYSALELAHRSGNANIVQLLQRHGAVAAINISGRYAYQAAEVMEARPIENVAAAPFLEEVELIAPEHEAQTKSKKRPTL